MLKFVNNLKCRIKNLKFSIQNLKCRIQNLKCRLTILITILSRTILKAVRPIFLGLRYTPPKKFSKFFWIFENFFLVKFF